WCGPDAGKGAAQSGLLPRSCFNPRGPTPAPWQSQTRSRHACRDFHSDLSANAIANRFPARSGSAEISIGAGSAWRRRAGIAKNRTGCPRQKTSFHYTFGPTGQKPKSLAECRPLWCEWMAVAPWADADKAPNGLTDRVSVWPLADIASCAAHVRFQE